MSRSKKYPTPDVNLVHPSIRAEELTRVANDALDRFSGQFDDLEKAIGMLMLGDYVGWKVLIMVHNKRTIRKYEEILGIKVREFFPEEGPVAMRSVGYEMAIKLGNFWKAVSGDIAIENRRDLSQ
ncbi:hypothetical protein E4K72_07500 [Oxalobacteraceae bacterium OM1]|nr:hypothetical protein E4K72_07500 [Oxalobacteraceae bacterium OM1]